VRYLAGLGPRETTSSAFRSAATFVENQFLHAGYRVRRQRFHVEGGVSNRVAVQAGDTFNLIAEPPGFEPTARHVVVGAHLDTVPQAPGAVDNAAGIAIIVELAQLAMLDAPALPIVFVAFGAEESRVPGGGLRGSREYVASLTAAERRAVAYMVAIDRIGTGSRVPVCASRSSARPTARRLLDVARRVGVPAYECTNGSSDHASFSAVGIPAIRLGPDNYPEYHTARDVPAILVAAQVARAGTLLREVLRSGV
jgi:Zn-dependent M28 family amino/carboxypeptidase